MLQRLILGLLSAFWLSLATAHAQTDATVGDGDRASIRGVIESQLGAFQRDDGAKAFSYAAPGIQRKFGNPDIFMQMVRSGYAMVYRPREVQILDLRINGSTIQQDVLFVGPDGKPVIAVYTMEQQEDGSWRIAGVYLRTLPQETT